MIWLKGGFVWSFVVAEANVRENFTLASCKIGAACWMSWVSTGIKMLINAATKLAGFRFLCYYGDMHAFYCCNPLNLIFSTYKKQTTFSWIHHQTGNCCWLSVVMERDKQQVACCHRRLNKNETTRGLMGWGSDFCQADQTGLTNQELCWLRGKFVFTTLWASLPF